MPALDAAAAGGGDVLGREVMGYLPIDITNRATIQRMAALPYYGQAEAIIRLKDEFWKVDPEAEHLFEVRLERSDCDCNCPNCYSVELKTVRIEAYSAEEAESKAQDEHPDWEVFGVRLPQDWRKRIPEDFQERTPA
jgi:hypothetical protein